MWGWVGVREGGTWAAGSWRTRRRGRRREGGTSQLEDVKEEKRVENNVWASNVSSGDLCLILGSQARINHKNEAEDSQSFKQSWKLIV